MRVFNFAIVTILSGCYVGVYLPCCADPKTFINEKSNDEVENAAKAPQADSAHDRAANYYTTLLPLNYESNQWKFPDLPPDVDEAFAKYKRFLGFICDDKLKCLLVADVFRDSVIAVESLVTKPATQEKVLSAAGAPSQKAEPTTTEAVSQQPIFTTFAPTTEPAQSPAPQAEKPKVGASEKFRKEAVAAHNAYRAKHAADPLMLSDKLNDWAQDWADSLAKDGVFRHRPKTADGPKYGENIYLAMKGEDQEVTAAECVDFWYSELKNYDFSHGGFNATTGHFTQVVWKATKEMGIGLARMASGDKTFVVANYDPPGNMGGEYEANVQKPTLIPNECKIVKYNWPNYCIKHNRMCTIVDGDFNGGRSTPKCVPYVLGQNPSGSLETEPSTEG